MTWVRLAAITTFELRAAAAGVLLELGIGGSDGDGDGVGRIVGTVSRALSAEREKPSRDLAAGAVQIEFPPSSQLAKQSKQAAKKADLGSAAQHRTAQRSAIIHYTRQEANPVKSRSSC
ncbi:hypothetical protein M0802_002534 [Mischocyttarus mexicanus]|nr:hypothetical protein M0802_002534 [Mischocyttarus mexicanus]